MHKLYYIILFCFIFEKKITAHIAIIPYPFTNREYPIDFFSAKDIFENFLNSFDVLITAVFFNREEFHGFDRKGKSKNISVLFHGDDHFDLSDLSPERKIIMIDASNELYKNKLGPYEYIKYEGKVFPYYKMHENGIVFGCDIATQRNNITYAFQARLPIVKKTIENDENWRNIHYADEAIIFDKRIILEPYNKYFQVRGDYLQEKKIIPSCFRYDQKNSGILFTDSIEDDYFLKKNSKEVDFDYRAINKVSEDYDEIIDDGSKIFAITRFNENAEPTEASIDFFNVLDASIDHHSNEIYQEITKGHYVNRDIALTSISKNYIAPLDLQCNIEKKFFDTSLSLNGLISVVIPFFKKSACVNYLENAFFDDHFAMRFGSQASYQINQYYKIVGYASWQYNFPKTEMIPAVFENQSAFGLNPLYLKGKTSWSEYFIATDLVISYSKHVGGCVGYEFFKKTGDIVSPEVSEFYTISGEIYSLNYKEWQNFTDSFANIAVFSLYSHFKQLQISAGFKAVLSGKNIMNMREVFIQGLFVF